MRVLIAEDDNVSRLILLRAVQKFGHECLAARDGLEAWELFQDSDVDMVISDWMMPGMDGIELCRRIRAEDGRPYTYFIFVTALGDKEHLIAGITAGADDYLTKPFDPDELQIRLITAARVTVLHRQLREQRAELERLNSQLFDQARRDPLTQLGNRLRLREDLEALVGRVERYGHGYCAALCDIDFFKAYNDTYGHLAGDEVLALVARTLARGFRRGDTVYRYGGEEFLVILPVASLEAATTAVERVRNEIEALGIAHRARPAPEVITMSAGIASLLPGSGKTVDTWLEEADQALYAAKAAGRNRIAVGSNTAAAS